MTPSASPGNRQMPRWSLLTFRPRWYVSEHPQLLVLNEGGSVELSATPYYHPILPLLCDTNGGEQSTPGLSLPTRRFRRPEDASLQIERALDSHEALFGVRPKGLWPSEGSVS